MSDFDLDKAREWAESTVAWGSRGNRERVTGDSQRRVNAARALLALLDEKTEWDAAEKLVRSGAGILPQEIEPTIRRLSQGEMMVWAIDYHAMEDEYMSAETAMTSAANKVCVLRGETCTPAHVQAFLEQVRGG
jgi:hypothetical protein